MSGMNTLLGFRLASGLHVLAYALKTVLVGKKRFFLYLARGLGGKGGKITLLKQ